LDDELVPAIRSDKIGTEEALVFAHDVLDRFRNPFLRHRWLSICLQYSSKMKTRNVLNIRRYYEKEKSVPERMAAGLAGWLLFMKTKKINDSRFAGNLSGKEYVLQDDAAEKLHDYWEKEGSDTGNLVTKVLKDQILWGEDLTAYPRFAERVNYYLDLMLTSEPSAFFSILANSRPVRK
jgi:tagaturonate reductase